MSTETYRDQLSRVQMMASGSGTWDLSPNDLAALMAVLERLGLLYRMCELALGSIEAEGVSCGNRDLCDRLHKALEFCGRRR